MNKEVYFKRMKGGIFKLLPLREEEKSGENVYLDVYIQSLLEELTGAAEFFPELKESQDYLGIITTISYMAMAKEEMSFSSWRRKVFNMLTLLDRMGGVN